MVLQVLDIKVSSSMVVMRSPTDSRMHHANVAKLISDLCIHPLLMHSPLTCPASRHAECLLAEAQKTENLCVSASPAEAKHMSDASTI